MSKGTTIRNVRVSDALWTAVQVQTLGDGRTISDVVRDALELYLLDPAMVRDALARNHPDRG